MTFPECKNTVSGHNGGISKQTSIKRSSKRFLMLLEIIYRAKTSGNLASFRIWSWHNLEAVLQWIYSMEYNIKQITELNLYVA